ncbi:MAG: autotransporter outer membrane beta-barrel domain-containing protein [Acetobacter sp.]|nr:autotransporter outer membrane beta-barrel domain-containing protein [Acetobacter sp.]
MKFRTDIMFSTVCVAAVMAVGNVFAMGGRLSPQDFNKMYFLAQHGKVGILREAVNRGLNIDAVNPNGDTGLCIAIKRKDHVAYNTFRMSGANPRHQCTYRIYRDYQAFLEEGKVAKTEQIVGNEESLYAREGKSSWLPWLLGGAALGGGVWALSSGGGGSKSQVDQTIITNFPEYGLTKFIDNYYKLVSEGVTANTYTLDGTNPNAANVVDKIAFLPNMLDNAAYLRAYVKVVNGATFNNLSSGHIKLGDAAVGVAAYGVSSQAYNNGVIDVDARNGAIGMAASNGAVILNNPDNGDGKIDIVFKGGKEGDAVIGMYADTASKAVNYGTINGTSSKTPVTDGSSGSIDIGDNLVGDDDITEVTSTNSGAILGMAVFDFYTGMDNASKTVSAENYGDINLSAGYNSAKDVSVNLVGMGSYIDDRFLNGVSNPAFAEQMRLNNYGDISLKYDGIYKVSDTALKLGDGGLIGMRADASTQAVNRGNIDILLTSTEMSNNTDVAAGMLSVHGAELINGTKNFLYDGQTDTTGGTIRITNEAKSGGVSYGMLAAKGDGTQTKLYQWKAPKLYNYGLIDMLTSNAYAMASFAGGEAVNNGVINLGVELGQSYYTNNYGLYAAGGTVSEEVLLKNNGIINIYSEQSTALYNAFNGSVSLQNNGHIYISNKATNSKVFGGNFSEAINNGDVFYKVGNSENFTYPAGNSSDVGYNEQVSPVVSVMQASSNDDTTKQYIVNNGTITLGAKRSEVDYGGTYGTAAIQVSKQGSAENNNSIMLDMYDKDTVQLNVGMWLDSTTTAESYINNNGSIVVDAVNSTGMRNDSQNGAQATNSGEILLNGEFSHGMSVTQTNGTIFNGRYNSITPSVIRVKGNGSVGMYVENGAAYNYGLISLNGDNTTAIQLSGESASLVEPGEITHLDGLDNVTYFWMHNGATREFIYKNPVTVNGYTLAKATQKGNAYFSRGSTAYVSGSNSHLLVAEDSGAVYNKGLVYAEDGTKAIVSKEGGEAYNYGQIDVESGSVGMYGENNDTYIGTSAGSLITVKDGTGISAEDFAEVKIEGNINVNKGIGIYLADGSISAYTLGTNDGVIMATGEDSIGAKVVDGAVFVNETGNISAASGAYGIYSTSRVTNNGNIGVSKDSIGIYAAGGEVQNTGTIQVSGGSAYGVYNVGAKVQNDGTIVADTGGIGVYGTVKNTKDIQVYQDSIGVDGVLDNQGGNITTYGSGVGVRGSGLNTGTITSNGAGAAVIATGTFSNSGNINAKNLGVQVDGGNFENTGDISVTSGKAVYVTNGSAVNYNNITVGNGTGMYVSGASSSALNEGVIVVSNSGYGAYVTDSASFVNTGTISYDREKGGACANISVGGECIDASEKSEETATVSAVQKSVYVGENAKFVNAGEVDFGKNVIDFDAMREKDGAFVVAKDGTFKAESFKGDVVAGKDIVLEGFADKYVNEKAFEGVNNGLAVKSESYLFEAKTTENDDTIGVELNRKKFEEVVEKKDLAQFWETNYQLQHNEKMFNALKSAETTEEFDETTKIESGKNFYANLPRENMAVLRGLNTQEQNRILENGLDGVYAGADYYRTGKNAAGDLSGYADNVYSPYIGFGKRLNSQWRVGGTLRAAYVDAEYDEAHSSRNNKILLASLPVLYQNGDFKFLMTPSVGVGFGEYERKALSGSYEADTVDLYYGMYNHAEYSVDMKVAELVMDAELNLQGSSMSKAKEDNEGLNLRSNNSLSFESGVGVKLRKRIELAKQRSLMLAVGVKYYHEFLDPYKDLTVGMSGSPVNYKVNAYDENKDRIRTSAEAVYKDGDFSLAAEIAHNIEKENNVEGGVGVRYNF